MPHLVLRATIAALTATGLVALSGAPSATAAPGEAYSRTWPKPARMAMTDDSVVVIAANGVPYGFGANPYGMLTGSGTRTTLTKMTGLPKGVRATSVALGAQNSLVLGSDGTVYGAGRNNYHQLTGSGTDDVTTLRPLAGLPAGVKATRIAVGAASSVVVADNGKVYAIGYNGYGQLAGAADEIRLTAMDGLPNGVKAKYVAAGPVGTTLVVGSDHVAYGAGRNGTGELGSASAGGANVTALTPVAPWSDVWQVAADGNLSLLMREDGTVAGSGVNTAGQLTDRGDYLGTVTEFRPLVRTPSGGVMTHVMAAGQLDSWTLDIQGTLRGTGSNNFGQLGTGSSDNALGLTPIDTSAIGRVTEFDGSYSRLVVGAKGLWYRLGGQPYTSPGSTVTSTWEPLPGQVTSASRKPSLSQVWVGRRASLDVGRWLPAPTSYTITWKIGSRTVSTSRTWTPKGKDAGRTVVVRVTGVRAGLVSTTSMVSAKVRPR